jgi:hypothetical protein
VLPKYHDIHISAYRLSLTTIKLFEGLGFQRDPFANNTRCSCTVYHGTFRGDAALPSETLWSAIAEAVALDEAFVGTVEQESFDDVAVRFIRPRSGPVPLTLPCALRTRQPRPGEYKECDIHINVACATTSSETLASIEGLGLASFDKPGVDGVHRIFSITCDEFHAAKTFFECLVMYLDNLPDLSAKLKLERTDKYLRIPADAPCLPMSSCQDLAEWTATLRASCP